MKKLSGKKILENLLFFLIVGVMLFSCSTTRKNATQEQDPYEDDTTAVWQDRDTARTANDTVRISNDSLEYEIIIIDPGFSYFLNSRARPEGYHSQQYLENKNRFLVTDYNSRVRQPFRYSTNIYTQEIDYSPQIDYGYEVNYKLYYYFVYLSERYNQRFSVSTRI